jgi:hypothetical protein
MNSLGVDVQVVSTGAGFYYYDKDVQTITAMHRECNDEVHQMTMDHPEHFTGETIRALKEAYARH